MTGYGSIGDSLIGRIVGQVCIEERIGSGGMGVIFRARHKILGTQHAIKILHPQFAANRRIIERFRREALAISSMKHENVVFVMDFGWEQGIGAYQVMELLEGHNLAVAIHKEEAFPKNRLLHLCSQVASVLSCAHSNGILHRDLKPDNVFLCEGRDGEAERVKVLDFGIAKIVQEETMEKLTRTGIALGTPYYMSPEQAAGRWEEVDHRTDIFSFGAMLYEVLAGEPPIPKGNFTDVLLKQVNGELTPLSTYRPDLAGHYIEKVLTWALAFDRELRPAHVNDFMKELSYAISAMSDPDPSISMDAVSVGNEFDTMMMPALPEGGHITLQSQAARPSAGGPLGQRLPTGDVDLALDVVFSETLRELEHNAPAQFNMQNLRGFVQFGAAGNWLQRGGFFPEACIQALSPLEGISEQLSAVFGLQGWQRTLIETDENMLAMFPYLDGTGSLFFGQVDRHQSMALDSHQMSSSSALQLDPIAQIFALAGVHSVLLFSQDGELLGLQLDPSGMQDQQHIQLGLFPVIQILSSIPFQVRGLDIWFSSCRCLLWDLQPGILFTIANHRVNKLMLSVLVGRQAQVLRAMRGAAQQPLFAADSYPQAQMNQPPQHTPGQGLAYTPPANAQSANNVFQSSPSTQDSTSSHEEIASKELIKAIQEQYTGFIGPMSTVVIKKTAKKMGYNKKTLPKSMVLDFVNQLASKLQEPKRSAFIENCAKLVMQG